LDVWMIASKKSFFFLFSSPFLIPFPPAPLPHLPYASFLHASLVFTCLISLRYFIASSCCLHPTTSSPCCVSCCFIASCVPTLHFLDALIFHYHRASNTSWCPHLLLHYLDASHLVVLHLTTLYLLLVSMFLLFPL
jgi:hypothetical protein